MTDVHVLVNKEDPLSEEILNELERNLKALQGVIQYRRIERKAEEDELFGLVEIIGFALLARQILKVVKTAVEIVKDVLEIKELTRKQKKPPVVIVVDRQRLAFPATEEEEEEFLGGIEALEQE